MFLKFLMGKPMLGLGILMITTVWLSSLGYLNIGLFKNGRLVPTPCRAALVRLERQLPANWKVSCNDNNLTAEVQEMKVAEDARDFRAALYRQLANHLVELARASQYDILEKIYLIHLRVKHPRLEINAISEGKYVSKLATLTNPDFIKDHLKQTVQVKETVK